MGVDDDLPYWYELRHTSIMGRYDHDQGASILERSAEW